MGKKQNEYALTIPSALYGDMPKTVIAAIAVSYLVRLEGEGVLNTKELVAGYLHQEWDALYKNEIVPQKPTVPYSDWPIAVAEYEREREEG